MEPDKVTKTTVEETNAPTVPIESVVTEETVSVPEVDATREAHRVSGEPDRVIRETVVTEETLKDD